MATENEYRKPNNQKLKGSDIIYKGKALTLGSDEYRQPTHYQLKGLDIESIDIIKSILNEDKKRILELLCRQHYQIWDSL